MAFTPTKKQLIRQAEQIEADAEKSLQMWVALREGNKYSEAMERARCLRRAAEQSTPALRREYAAAC